MPSLAEDFGGEETIAQIPARVRRFYRTRLRSRTAGNTEIAGGLRLWRIRTVLSGPSAKQGAKSRPGNTPSLRTGASDGMTHGINGAS